jgi:hypothetical protein
MSLSMWHLRFPDQLRCSRGIHQGKIQVPRSPLLDVISRKDSVILIGIVRRRCGAGVSGSHVDVEDVSKEGLLLICRARRFRIFLP